MKGLDREDIETQYKCSLYSAMPKFIEQTYPGSMNQSRSATRAAVVNEAPEILHMPWFRLTVDS